MRPELARQIATINTCVVPTELWRERMGVIILGSAYSGNAADSAEVSRFVQCVDRGGARDRCLQRVAGSNLQAPQHTSYFYDACREVSSTVVRAHYDHDLVYWSHEMSRILFSNEAANLSRDERSFLGEMAGLVSRRTITPDIEPALASRTAHRQHYDLYQGNQESHPFTQSFVCPNASDFDTEVVYAGSYSVSVYFPKTQYFPKNFLMWDLESGLRVMQLFFHPDDFQRLLHPEHGHDLSFYVTGPFSEQDTPTESRSTTDHLERALVQCGTNTPPYGGMFHPNENRIWIRAYPGSPTEFHDNHERSILGDGELAIDPAQYSTTSETWDSLFHEVGHAIATRFLQSTPAWQNIERFFRWTQEQARRNPNQPEILPNYSYRVSRRLNSVRLNDPRQYSNTDVDQFFAELVQEYFSTEASGRGPDNSYFRARRRIMQNYFGARLNLQAFLPEAINQAFQAEGLTIHVQGEPTPQPPQNQPPQRVSPTTRPRAVIGRPRSPIRENPPASPVGGFEVRAFYGRGRDDQSVLGGSLGIATFVPGRLNYGVSLVFAGTGIGEASSEVYIAGEGSLRTPHLPAENPFFSLEGFVRFGGFVTSRNLLFGVGARVVFHPASPRFQLFGGGQLGLSGGQFLAEGHLGTGWVF